MNVYIVTEGYSSGIQKMLYMMDLYLKKLRLVIKFKQSGDPVSYAFIVLFQEPGSVGSFTALVNDRGTTSDYSGSGPTAYAEMMSFIEEKGIKLYEAGWDDITDQYPAFSERLRALKKGANYTGETAELWRGFLSAYIWEVMPDLDYEASDKWERKARQKDTPGSRRHGDLAVRQERP